MQFTIEPKNYKISHYDQALPALWVYSTKSKQLSIWYGNRASISLTTSRELRLGFWVVKFRSLDSILLCSILPYFFHTD